MRISYFFVMLCFLWLLSGCSNNKQLKENEPSDPGPKATGPTEERLISERVNQDELALLSSKSIDGTWILQGYDIENYVYYSGMKEHQKKNFEQLVVSLIGKMKFIIKEGGDFESHTGLKSHHIGKWYIDESGQTFTMQQEFEVMEQIKNPASKTNIYTINQFSKNFLTLTDTDKLTFVFEKSK